MRQAKSEPTSGAWSGQSMDRALPRRSPWPTRVVAGALVVLAAVVAYRLVLARADNRSTSVDRSRITIGSVAQGQFDDIIQVRARVTPLRTTFIDTASGGQVEAILVEDGARVSRGQPVVELSNTQLQLDLISREAQITEQLNNLRGLELAQEQTRLVHEREMVEVHYQIKRLERAITRTEPLVERGISPRNDLDDLRDQLAYYRQRRAVQTETRKTADRLQAAQLSQMRTAAKQLEANLELARRNLDALKVAAPIDGQLTALNLQVGQTLAPGERIAQIDDPDHYKLVADIDEFYLSRVDIGQEASYPVGDVRYRLTVARIRPQVQNSQFQIELTFDGDAPPDVRRGQTAQIELQLGQPTPAVLVPNGPYYHDTGGAWVFVVTSDRTRAHRRQVRLGRRNPQFIEVLDGLSVGENIVTSSYSNYLDRQRLDLTR